MRDFGESLCLYKPPIDTKTVEPIVNLAGSGGKQVVLNWITPHQKCVITSYSIHYTKLYDIPAMVATSIQSTGTPRFAITVFSIFYLSCVLATWWWYRRSNARNNFV